MGQKTEIAWCDHTMNFWIGCTKVSGACDHCYAETLMDHRMHRVQWGGERVLTSDANWRQPYRWNEAARKAGVRRRVFTLSLGDFFDNQVPEEWRHRAWDIIGGCQNLDWLILTKRPQNIAKMLPGPLLPFFGHVWLGCTAENQEEADRRIPALLAVPAAWHFISAEPLLGPLRLNEEWLAGGLDLCIVGGESGLGARPMDPVWARSLRDQCQAAKVAYFFKQWGDWHPDALRYTDVHTGDCPPASMFIGKRKTGRLLDGREWSEMPGER